MNTLTLMHALPALLGLLAKMTILLLAAWAASALLRRSSAAVRHVVWASALGGVLLLPALSLGLPRWNVAVQNAVPQSAIPQQAISRPPAAAMPAGAETKPLPPASEHSAVSRTALPAAPLPVPRRATSFPLLLICAAFGCCIWVLGFLLVLAQFFVGLYRIGRISKQAAPLDGDALVLADAARRHGTRPARFLRASPGSGLALPVTWGFLRPVVLLPEQSAAWPEGCTRAALLHELAHVQRGDWLMQTFARFACAVYWWHPLVWLAAAQVRAESERACDDLVLSTGMKAADYAQRLVEVVRSLPPAAAPLPLPSPCTEIATGVPR